MNLSTLRILPLLCLLATSAAHLHGAENQAILVEKEGRVVLTKSGKPTAPAEKGAVLEARDRIGTGESSRAVLRMSERWFARIDEETELTITPAAFGAKDAKALDVALGGAFIYSREAEGEVQIQTPSATGGLRGTQLLVRVAKDGTSHFHVLEGRVDLANPHGRVSLAAGEAGEASKDKAPRKTAVIQARNILQWALYYPAVLQPEDLPLSQTEQRHLDPSLNAYRQGDLLAALALHPKNIPPTSTNTRLYHAAVLLAAGRVDAARAAIAQTPTEHPARKALELMLAAVLLHERPAPLPDSPSASALIAESYYQQSRSQLAPALDAARRAAALLPTSGFAWTRVAELEFSHGRIPAARAALARALHHTPRNAQAHALSGFLLCAENRIAPAQSAFEAAIAIDPALGNAWLGLGLTKIKQGHTSEGRADLQTAATLEPTRSFLYSYHGKALSAAGLSSLARKDLDLARQLDPADPTPWLYSAIQNQQENAYNTAIADFRESLRLNENRRVYRSQFLLDQDRAVRGANLAKVYQNAGMDDLAVREAVRAVEADYSNPSAHLFLANAYDALRDPSRVSLRHETPWFNELLLSFLLSPVGGGPLSQFVSQQEYSKLLETDGLGGSYLGEWRSDGILTQRASTFLTSGRFSAGIDALYHYDNGLRPNNATSREEIYWQFKYQLSPDDVLYSLGKFQDQESGDRFLTTDNRPLSPRLDFEEKQQPGLLLAGLNHRWAPGSHTLFLGGRLAAQQRITDPLTNQLILAHSDAPPLGSIPPESIASDPFNLSIQRKFEIYSAELQHLWDTEHHTLLLGSRIQDGTFSTSASLSALNPATQPLYSNPAADQLFDTPFSRQSFYTYDFLKLTPTLTLLGGASWDHIEKPVNFRSAPISSRSESIERFNPKIGAVFSPSQALSLRAAYTESLGGVSFDESVRLEPAQFAGFNQSFRTIISESLVGSVEAPVFKTLGLAAEGALPSNTWWSASLHLLRQEVDRSTGAFELLTDSAFPTGQAIFPSSTPQQLRYDERILTLGLNQLIDREFALGARYRHTTADLSTSYPLIPSSIAPAAHATDSGTLQHLLLCANWNSPSGWFARAEANWYSQNQERSLASLPPTHTGDDDFWQFHLQTGYRFHRNLCEITTGILNITGADYRLSPLTSNELLPRDPTLFVRVRLSF